MEREWSRRTESEDRGFIRCRCGSGRDDCEEDRKVVNKVFDVIIGLIR